jgi:hypothetical protein
MTDYSALTDGYDVLTGAAIQTLTDEGYTYNPLTTSFSQYLATALTGIGGSSVSHLRMSMPELLAGLVNELGGGPVTHLNTTVAQLLALLGSASEPPVVEGVLSASGGSFIFSADSMTPIVDHKLSAAAGSFVMTGQAATLTDSTPSGLMLDGITAGIKAAYSTRKLLTAYAGPAIRVERTSDGTPQDIGFSSNVIDTATLATFCSGTTGKVIKWYDQSGNGNDQDNTDSTISNSPIIYQAGAVVFINTTRPALLFDGNHDALGAVSMSSSPVDTLYQAVVLRPDSFASDATVTGGRSGTNGALQWRIDGGGAGTQSLLSNGVAGIGTSSSPLTVSQAAVIESQYNSSTGAYSFWLNGATSGTGTQARTLNANIASIGACGLALQTETFNGAIGEIVMYDQVGSFASRAAVAANQKAYWGTP